MKRIFICLLGLALIACKYESKNDLAHDVKESLKYDTSKMAILSWSATSSYPFDTVQYQSATLTQSEIDQMDSIVISVVSAYNNSLAADHDEYKIEWQKNAYKKQLVPVLNEKGEKEIWVNCFCDDADPNWKKEILIVFDGGPCYFNFKVNLSKRKVYDLEVNGFG